MRVAGQDIAEKILEAYDDVFADIVNGLLFNGDEARGHRKSGGPLPERRAAVARGWDGLTDHPGGKHG